MKGVRAAPPRALATRRIAAWAVDWLIISAYAVALVPLGILLVGRDVRLPQFAWNALAFTLLILPATGWLAGWERGRRGATPGKRLLRLRTSGPGGGRLSWRRALARNALKVA
ncbi:MAG TPA: RDD family protein [Actinoplanes sp.]|nr:RDD family protein [Actinoplanes sp.]